MTYSPSASRIIRSREATDPIPISLIISRAPGISDLTNSTVLSVQPSAVIRISFGGGFILLRTWHVRIRSCSRFLVVIIIDTDIVLHYRDADSRYVDL